MSIKMVGFNSFVLLCVLLVAFGDASPKARSDVHNLELCSEITQVHTLALETQITEPGKLFKTITKSVSFPTSDTRAFKPGTISCIIVKDLIGNGNGGYPTITAGGVGNKNVDITFISQCSKGLSFSIKIYTA